MDRSLDNPLPDLSQVDDELGARIMAGRESVLLQVEYFRNNFGLAQSRWKKDGTRVTDVDEAISKEMFDFLSAKFPEDDYCSEESAENPEPLPLNGEFAWVLDPVDGTNNYAVGSEWDILGLWCACLDLFTTTGGIFFRVAGNWIDGRTTRVHATTDLVVLCMHFHPIDDLGLFARLYRVAYPLPSRGRSAMWPWSLDGCLEFRSKPWTVPLDMLFVKGNFSLCVILLFHDPQPIHGSLPL